MNDHRFAPASPSETIVFGACRPGYSSQRVDPSSVAAWIEFMKGRGIRRVCCLLGQKQLAYYSPALLDQYGLAFGQTNVLSAEIEDYHLCDKATLETQILPFIDASDHGTSPVVVHCSGGSGRTGHVLAAWLVRRRGYAFDAAVATLGELLRDPEEAVHVGNATDVQLRAIVCGESSISPSNSRVAT